MLRCDSREFILALSVIFVYVFIKSVESDCDARCTGTNCTSGYNDQDVCTASCRDTECRTACFGVRCISRCNGIKCIAGCEGDFCNASCFGLNCKAWCRGTSCSKDNAFWGYYNN